MTQTVTAPALVDEVTLLLPAAPAYLSLLRTTCAHLAARLDLTIDDIDDVRMAADEAANLLLAAAPGGTLTLTARLGESLELELSVPAGTAALDRTSFAWTVLSALADSIEAREDERLTLVLTKNPYKEGM